MSFVFDIAAAQQASAMGKFNQAVYNRNAQIKEQEAKAIAQQTEFDIARFDQNYQKLVGSTNVAAAKSGIQRSGTFFNVQRYNAEQAEIQKDVIEYNSNVAQSQKIEEANFARISGQIRRQEARIAQLGYYSRAGESLLRIGQAKGII
jgi:tetrahydromethanopterin S-methyltransferase subunit H